MQGDTTQTLTTGAEAALHTFRCVKCGRFLGEGVLMGESFFEVKCLERHCRQPLRVTKDGIVSVNRPTP